MFGFGRKKKQKAAPPAPAPISGAALHRLKVIQAKYDAAQTSLENQSHWALADGLSANAANSPMVRATVRNRARYEIANNTYARGMVDTIADWYIGRGPRLQMRTLIKESNRELEAEFAEWAEQIQLGRKLRTLIKSRVSDGEGFAFLTTNERLSGSVKLDVTLIEADQITTPDLHLTDAHSVDGIRLDEDGNPIEYHKLKIHPGDGVFSLDAGYDTVPAEFVIHLFRCQRPGQARGIADIMPALPLFALLRRYTLATIVAAEIAATMAGVVHSDAGADDDPDAVTPFDEIELERGAFTTLPAGWDISQLKAEQPTTVYPEFKKEIINEIARCLGIPYNIAAANSSGYNYASGRLDHQSFFKQVEIEQREIERIVMRPILHAWLSEYLSVKSAIGPSDLNLRLYPFGWFWDGQEHVDPAKEANAQNIRLANHTTTLAHEYARQGRDWEESLRQRAKELSLMQELGLTRRASRRATVETFARPTLGANHSAR